MNHPGLENVAGVVGRLALALQTLLPRPSGQPLALAGRANEDVEQPAYEVDQAASQDDQQVDGAKKDEKLKPWH